MCLISFLVPTLIVEFHSFMSTLELPKSGDLF